MRVVVKEPIQSLNAFGRHINGGRNAALPLFNLRHRIIVLSAVVGLTAFAADAQQKDTNRSIANEQRIDLLFDQIMKTLPDGERMKVDSAASMEVNRRESARTAPSAVSHERGNTPRTTRVNDLPPELKAQVERTINSMETRKEERKAQFRESARERR